MLSNRNRVRLRNFGRMFGGRRRACNNPHGTCLGLDSLLEGSTAIITCNRHLPTIERGLVQGVHIEMFRNDLAQPNVIIAVGDARYVLDRRIAREIRVKVL
ncbi:MAG: ferrous iron transport protein A [Candidatus Cloacimonetes bacterium]|nr:ferrous iron transport protein A [Candidatus Cloacimonadota bacterium]